MKDEEKSKGTFQDSIAAMNANNRKAHIISSIIEKAEQGEEEENKGRS